MSTLNKAIATTNPKYSTGSGLMLEVKHANQEHWTKLKSAEPYSNNREVSLENQIKALNNWKDEWVSNGPSSYRTAKFRIGHYGNFPGVGYAWIDAT